MHLFDTHCHLNHPQYDACRDSVLERARSAGIGGFLVVGYDLPSSERAVQLARDHPDCWAAVGIHPHAAAEWSDDTRRQLRDWAADPRVRAIGEIGLDFVRNRSPEEAQRRAFRTQLDLAAEVGLPVILHTRESVAECLETVGPWAVSGRSGVFHCWSGTASEAERARGLGFRIGIGGVVTYRTAAELRTIVAAAPEESLLLETDCPYLAPLPHRGRTNEPAYLPLVAACVASERRATLEEVAAATTRSAHRLFRLEEARSV